MVAIFYHFADPEGFCGLLEDFLGFVETYRVGGWMLDP